MMGPGLCSLLLSVCITFSSFQPAHSKPLAMSRVPVDDETGLVVTRFRRDALPYEGEMFAYPSGEAARNEAFYAPLASQAAMARLGLGPRERELLERQGLLLSQAEVKPGWGRKDGDERLGEALQRLLEDSRRRDQEAAYLANLLQAWSELGLPEAYPGGGGEATDNEAGPEPRNGYPDYDELAAGRYGNRQPAYLPPGRPGLEEMAGEGGGELEEQVVRYLVGRILANLDAGTQRLARRDLLPSLPEGPGPRRVRRALPQERGSGSGGRTNLLRVKRLGGLDGEEEDGGEEEGGAQEGIGYPSAAKEAQGLQRMKRIEGHLPEPGTLIRNRRYSGYQGAELAERFIKFLPD
ncbi:proprotein convertase subtilisin/kexin type 1 inhibitor, like [Mustelus asterias]